MKETLNSHHCFIKVGVEILQVEQLAQAIAGLSESDNEARSQKPLKQRGAKITTIFISNKKSISYSMRFFDF
ncbi:hypothetical protein [Candidatus Williamhamiltonella defendens]|uniref:hypothetical protein n=1 Tax=Candidatus Williamhamiltonella defendens TaxID=138072 RepID=UPI00130E966A|nr:hypothetical protein [Candidatus Hamiltonella defensa]